MTVRVKVIRFRDQPWHEVWEAPIDDAGGHIGRRDGSALVLPNDPSVSREHGRIFYENGVYKYHDSSSNGTRLENYDRSVKNETVILNDGDILGIGDYSILVTIEVTDVFMDAPLASGGPVEDLASLWLSPTSPPALSEPPQLVPAAHEQVFSDPPAGSDPFMELLLGIGGTPDDEHAGIPGTVHEATSLPVAQDAPQLPSPSITVSSPDSRVPKDEDSLRHLLKGAGLEASRILQDVDHLEDRLEQVGRLLRAFVEGISLALQARADMKRQLRVSVTTIDANDNNPLKFSASIDQMLEMMLGMHSQGFKDPVVAVKEGFDDLVNHQLAMSAGIQGSLLSVLKRFDPERIEQSQDQGLAFQKKSKCWEEYRNAYPKLVSGALEDIFGEEFAATYERQLAQLRAAGNKH